MNIHIVYANVGAISNPQAQIIGAQYQFICQPELRFQVRTTPGDFMFPIKRSIML